MNGSLRDVIIVGAGPIGLACGVEAGRRSLESLILEKGCLTQSLVDFPLNMTFFSSSDKLEIGDVPFVSTSVKPTRAEALEYYRRVKDHWSLAVRQYERVSGVAGKRGNFTVSTVKGSYRCRSVVLAVGFYGCPNLLGIPGEDLPKVTHYYREPFPYVNQKVLVIGGGNSAVDAALEICRKGGEVTLTSRSPALDESVKYWIRPDIENRIREGTVKSLFSSEVIEIREGEVVLRTPEGELVLENDFVLAMTGYHPDYDFLTSIGVECTDDPSREPVYDPGTFESLVPGLYVAGVMCNGMRSGRWLIENSRFHARAIFDHMAECGLSGG